MKKQYGKRSYMVVFICFLFSTLFLNRCNEQFLEMAKNLQNQVDTVAIITKEYVFFLHRCIFVTNRFASQTFLPQKNNLDAPDKSSDSGVVCERSSEVERYLAKVDVEGSNPFARSRFVK